MYVSRALMGKKVWALRRERRCSWRETARGGERGGVGRSFPPRGELGGGGKGQSFSFVLRPRGEGASLPSLFGEERERERERREREGERGKSEGERETEGERERGSREG